MVKKYICTLCNKPCILEVEDNAAKPCVCPFNETGAPEWELMKGDEQT